jgi:hypothetical protein
MRRNRVFAGSFSAQQPYQVFRDGVGHHWLDNLFARRTLQEPVVSQHREHIAGQLLARRVAPPIDLRMARLGKIEEALHIGPDQYPLAIIPTRYHNLLNNSIEQGILAGNVEQKRRLEAGLACVEGKGGEIDEHPIWRRPAGQTLLDHLHNRLTGLTSPLRELAVDKHTPSGGNIAEALVRL